MSISTFLWEFVALLSLFAVIYLWSLVGFALQA